MPMLKKIILACVLGGAATASVSALSSSSLSLFGGDFNTLMTSITRDVAPSLRLGALAGDLQADATIEHFDLTLVSLGLNVTDGIGTVLRPGTTWNFAVPMTSFIPDGFSTWFENLMAYPSYKFAFGAAVGGGWDVTLSGNYLPSSLSGLLLKPVSGSKPVPDINYGNIGVSVRRALIKDTDSTPGLSVGAGYHFTSFHLNTKVDGWIPTVNVTGDNMTTTGTLGFDAGAQIVTLDLYLSKRLSVFTPFARLTGAYQNTTVTGNADITATTDGASSGNPQSATFNSHPSVNLSNFAFLTTAGFDLNLFVVHYNLNVMADLSRAVLNIHSFSLDGIDANAFTINTGFHWSF
jgi:hypothetical protein